MTMRNWATIPVGVTRVRALLILLTLPAWAGDAEVAEFLLEKGRKEFRAKHYEEAEKLFRRALAEQTPYPEAAFEHGQVLQKLGRSIEAAAAYQTCISAVDRADEPARKWKTVSGRAARALKKLRREFADLNSVNKTYVRKFMALGKAQMKSNPAWARRAFEAVLAIDPTHSPAKAYLAKLPRDGEAAAGAKKGKPWGKAMIRPDRLTGWDPGPSENWSIRGGVVTGTAQGRHGQINWNENFSLQGEYALQVRLRLIGEAGARGAMGIFIGDGRDDWWAIMLETPDELTLVRYENKKNNTVSAKQLDVAKWSSWHVLRVVVTKADVQFFFDGKLITDLPHSRRQPFTGQCALFVQDVKVEFKDLELRK